MSSFPPRHLCIVGAFFIAVGAGSVAPMIAGLIEGRFLFNLGFVMIPIGYGLLIGKDFPRKLVLFFTLLGLAGSAVRGGCVLYERWTGSALPSSSDHGSTMVEWILAAVCGFYLIMTLTCRKSREWFAAEKKDRAAMKSLAWAVGVVAAVFCFEWSLEERRIQETYEKASPFHVRVTLYNAQNGKGVTTYSYHSEAVSRAKNSKSMSKLPEMHARYIGGEDGPHFEFSGMAAQPFEVTLKSDGFQDKTITLSGKAEFEIRVPMQPLDSAKPEREGGGKPAAEILGQ